jgi:saccharopine dehydrogenase-like NADP-dependent oxidoreductase
MKNILVLGAGHVARPLVRYLLEQPDFCVKLATRTVSKAEKIIEDHPRGEAESLNITNIERLRTLIEQNDLVVSLLPPPHHPKIAELCVGLRKPMVTTSYVSKEMKQLDKRAKRASILLLNELGLDPGIDHMSAIRIIHKIQNKGGKITSFCSLCGALPAPEANTNPFGYKFSWAPRGLILDSKNPARYLKDGREVYIPGEELFENYSLRYIEGLGYFEAYPNRDSIPYIEKYGISGTKTMYRGTLRYIGWCETMKRMVDLGLLNDEKKNLEGLSYKEFFRGVINSRSENIKEDLASYLHIDKYSTVMKRIEWLGILSDEPLPLKWGSELDIMAVRLLEKLKYEADERDMDVMQHEFIVEYKDRKEKITSTLIDYGIPGGDTSIARTVGLPAAIGARLILEGKINLTGVQIPVSSVIYEPILNELEKQGITFREKNEIL